MTWRHFTVDEFKCKCGCGHNAIDHDFVDALDDLREELGFPLRITSGYRCPSHNDKTSTTGRNGPHTTGKAADIAVMGMNAFLLMQAAMASGRFYGVGINQKGPHAKRFIHLDSVESVVAFRPAMWTY